MNKKKYNKMRRPFCTFRFNIRKGRFSLSNKFHGRFSVDEPEKISEFFFKLSSNSIYWILMGWLIRFISPDIYERLTLSGDHIKKLSGLSEFVDSTLINAQIVTSVLLIGFYALISLWDKSWSRLVYFSDFTIDDCYNVALNVAGAQLAMLLIFGKIEFIGFVLANYALALVLWSIVHPRKFMIERFSSIKQRALRIRGGKRLLRKTPQG